MMKRKGKVLSLVLAAILTVSSGSVVQAAGYIDKSTEYTCSEGRGAESGGTEQYCKGSEGCKSESGKRTERNCESNENNSCRWKYSGYHDEYR